MDKTCENCTYRSQFAGKEVCRRYPPLAINTLEARWQEIPFPVISLNWSCGEWKK